MVRYYTAWNRFGIRVLPNCDLRGDGRDFNNFAEGKGVSNFSSVWASVTTAGVNVVESNAGIGFVLALGGFLFGSLTGVAVVVF